MDLLEIRLAVADHLDLSDIAVCVQVCREWHQTFVPFLYETLALHPLPVYNHYIPREEYFSGENCTPAASSDDELSVFLSDREYEAEFERAKPPPASALIRYGNYIRDLDLVLPDASLYSLAQSAQGIRTLSLQAPTKDDEEWTDYYREEVAQLLARNNHLQHLDLSCFDGPATSRHFDLFMKKTSCLQLEEIWLEESTFDIVKMVALLQDCPRLSRLFVISCVLTSDGDEELFPEGASVFPRIEQLELEHNIGLSLTGELNWIGRCPSLRELSWNPKKTMRYDATVNMSPLQQCLGLSSLTLSINNLEDSDLAGIFENCSDLTDLTLMGGRVGNEAFIALTHRFGKLTRLDLVQCELECWMHWRILRSCSSLVDFSGCVLESVRIMDDDVRTPPDSWACAKSLERLELQALIWSKEFGAHNNRLMMQLEMLERLEILTINYALFERDDSFATNVRNEHIEVPRNIPWKQGQFERRDLEQDDDMRCLLDIWPYIERFTYVGCGGSLWRPPSSLDTL